MPAVSPRARVRLRAVAVAFTVSSSLVVGIASAPAQASTTTTTTTSTAPVTSTGTTLRSAASALSLTAYESVAAKTTVKKPALNKAVHKVTKKPVTKKPATKHKVTQHKATKKKVVKKARKLAFGTRVVRDASVYKGTPYEYGASGPARFDCSGFTRYIFAKFGISLPHSSSAQYSMVRHISSGNKQIGDLIFFHTSGGHVYHVGIYAGNDEIWAATHTGDFVRLEGMWNASYYVGRIS